MELTERLKKARIDARLTQDELADKSGVTKSAISSIEIGRAKSIRAKNGKKIADALKVNYEWLMWGVGDMTGSSELHLTASPTDVTISPNELDAAAISKLADIYDEVEKALAYMGKEAPRRKVLKIVMSVYYSGGEVTPSLVISYIDSVLDDPDN